MPGEDGFDLARAIMQDPDHSRIAVIMMISSVRHEDTARCEELGIAAQIHKPVQRSELLQSIRDLMDTMKIEAAPPRIDFKEDLRPLRILLAEDNKINQKLAERILTKAGHSVVPVTDGKEVLSAMEVASFDLILMDVQMPEMDGITATEIIRSQEKTTGKHLPILAMTAHAMIGDKERCLEAGMDGYLSKPIRTDKLFHAIWKAVPEKRRSPGVKQS
jgi:CheY-like chemotaxis protein